MNIPTNLKHKPVVIVPNYAEIDGRNAYQSEAVGLSLGLAQWNDRGNVEIAAKVWRHTGEKWSRQSEELPLHRVLDLAILITRAKLHFRDNYRFPKGYDPAKPILDRIGLQGSAMTVQIATDNEMLETDMKLFEATLAKDDELLSERLATLARLLEDLGF